MRWILIAGLALGSLAGAASGAVADTSVGSEAKAPSAETKAAALRLARMLHSEESQIAMGERMADNEMATAFRKDKNMLILEGEYPGFIDEVIKELKPAMARHIRAELPTYHERVASLIAARFEASELEDLTRFYQTPTGQKLIRGMQQNVTIGSMLEEISTNPEKPTSYSAVATDHKTSAKAAIKLIDQSDHATLREFALKPYFTRVASLGPAMRKLEQDMSNEPSPEFEAEVGAIMTATLAKFEAAKR